MANSVNQLVFESAYTWLDIYSVSLSICIVMESTHSRNLNFQHLPTASLTFPVVGKLPFTEISCSSPGASLVIIPPQIVPNCYDLNSVSKSDYRIPSTSISPVFTAEVLDLSRNHPPSDEQKEGVQVANLPNGSSQSEKKLAMDNDAVRMETNKLSDPAMKGEDEDFEDEDSSDQKSLDEFFQHSNPGRG